MILPDSVMKELGDSLRHVLRSNCSPAHTGQLSPSPIINIQIAVSWWRLLMKSGPRREGTRRGRGPRLVGRFIFDWMIGALLWGACVGQLTYECVSKCTKDREQAHAMVGFTVSKLFPKANSIYVNPFFPGIQDSSQLTRSVQVLEPIDLSLQTGIARYLQRLGQFIQYVQGDPFANLIIDDLALFLQYAKANPAAITKLQALSKAGQLLLPIQELLPVAPYLSFRRVFSALDRSRAQLAQLQLQPSQFRVGEQSRLTESRIVIYAYAGARLQLQLAGNKLEAQQLKAQDEQTRMKARLTVLQNVVGIGQTVANVIFPSCSVDLERTLRQQTDRLLEQIGTQRQNNFVVFELANPESYLIEYVKMNPCLGLRLNTLSLDEFEQKSKPSANGLPPRPSTPLQDHALRVAAARSQSLLQMRKGQLLLQQRGNDVRIQLILELQKDELSFQKTASRAQQSGQLIQANLQLSLRVFMGGVADMSGLGAKGVLQSSKTVIEKGSNNPIAQLCFVFDCTLTLHSQSSAYVSLYYQHPLEAPLPQLLATNANAYIPSSEQRKLCASFCQTPAGPCWLVLQSQQQSVFNLPLTASDPGSATLLVKRDMMGSTIELMEGVELQLLTQVFPLKVLSCAQSPDYGTSPFRLRKCQFQSNVSVLVYGGSGQAIRVKMVTTDQFKHELRAKYLFKGFQGKCHADSDGLLTVRREMNVPFTAGRFAYLQGPGGTRAAVNSDRASLFSCTISSITVQLLSPALSPHLPCEFDQVFTLYQNSAPLHRRAQLNFDRPPLAVLSLAKINTLPSFPPLDFSDVLLTFSKGNNALIRVVNFQDNSSFSKAKYLKVANLPETSLKLLPGEKENSHITTYRLSLGSWETPAAPASVAVKSKPYPVTQFAKKGEDTDLIYEEVAGKQPEEDRLSHLARKRRKSGVNESAKVSYRLPLLGMTPLWTGVAVLLAMAL